MSSRPPPLSSRAQTRDLTLILEGREAHITVRADSSLTAIASTADKLTIHGLPPDGAESTAAVQPRGTKSTHMFA